MLFSDLRYDYVRTGLCKLQEVSFEEIEGLYFSMEEEGRTQSPRRPSSQRRSFWSVQPICVTSARNTLLRWNCLANFLQIRIGTPSSAVSMSIHAIRYGTSAPKEPADLVSLRTTILGTMRKPPRHTVDKGETEPPKRALRTTKEVFFRSQGFVPTPIFKREALRSGNRVIGPALIEEHASTTVVQPGDELTVDGLGNLQILIGSERK